MFAPKPTWSLAVLPTREFEEEIAPATPAVPLAQVTAPILLFQKGLLMMKLPFVNSTTGPPFPTKSPAVLPSSEFVAETKPLTPAVPLPHVTAPFLPLQRVLRTT